MLFDLLTELREALRPAFAHPRFINDREPGQMASVKIHIGQLPFKRETAGQNDYPYVLLQPVEGTDADAASEITVRMHCGVYNDELANQPEAGANDLMNLIDRLRRTVRALGFIGGQKQFELQLPVKWRLGDPDSEHLQPLPLNEGVVTATFNAPAPADVPCGEVQAALATTN
jgi:hypothetical protein